MALSKNFTLPEKCKNHWRALRESLILIRQFLYSKLFGSSLIFLRETGAGAASGHALSLFSLFFFFFPRVGARSKTTRQFLWWTFKFTLNEEREKERKKQTKERKEKQDIKKKQKENIQNGNHFATGCFFSLLYLQKKEHFCFSVKKISVFFVFHMNAAFYIYIFFTLISFISPSPSPFCRLAPSLKLPPPRSKMRSHAKKKQKTKREKNHKSPKKLKVQKGQ